MAIRSFHSLLARPVLVVFVLIVLLFGVTIEFVIRPWSASGEDGRRRAQFHFVCFAILSCFTCVSYVACVVLNAGFVPKEYTPDVESRTVLEVKRSVSPPVENEELNGI